MACDVVEIGVNMTGKGYGKTILFGEHFVVYGLPAIAGAIGSMTTADVEESNEYQLVDERPATPSYKKEKYDEQVESNKLIFDACGIKIDKVSLKITLGGDRVAASGVGASAASATAIARALNDHFGLGYSEDKINDIAYEGEKGYHGKPSGLDNTVSVFGGLIWFIKNLEGGCNTFEKLNMPKPVEIVLGNTGITSSTKEVVSDVKKKMDEKPDRFSDIFAQYERVVNKARIALIAGDLNDVGRLMDINHGLLQDILVSGRENDFLVEVAKDNGALGAKLTGTGRGGLVQALTPGVKLQDKVAKAIEAEGYTAYKTTIGV